MSVENEAGTPDETTMSRRESVRRAATLALGAGLGIPEQLTAMAPPFAQLQVKFYKGPTDGGALLGGVTLTDLVTSYVGSLAGAQTQVKWYDPLGHELGTMAIPSTIQSKIRLALTPGE
ncbi:MAG TPA: hypothetical protein VI259_03255 [Gemmatimonadaceae bacterium]